MREQLTPLDATFLELEQADASAHMHIGAVLLFEARPNGRAPSLARLRSEISSRLPALPRFTQRLSEPHTGGLTWPHWEKDPTSMSRSTSSPRGCPRRGARPSS